MVQSMFDKGTPVNLQRTGGIVSEGIHTVKIVDWEERDGPSGKYWNYTLEIVGDGNDQGKRLWLMISLSPAARWKLEEFLDAVAAPDEGIAHGPDFVGRGLRVRVQHEEYEGRVRARVANMLPLKSGTSSPSGGMFSLRTLNASTTSSAEEQTSPPPQQLQLPSLEDLIKDIPDDLLDDEGEEE